MAGPYCGMCGHLLGSIDEPCPRCLPGFYAVEQQNAGPDQIVSSRPMGCICPPTSEQTCMNQLCPRKPIGGLHLPRGPSGLTAS